MGVMRMRKMPKLCICMVLVVMVMFTLIVPAFAAKGTSTINAAYLGINLIIEGKLIIPKDSAGNAAEPFIYNGTTYLPVRAVSEALGKNVAWDGATATVTISGTTTPTVPFDGEPKSGVDTVYKNLSVTYNNIKIVIDGKEITPKDAAGNVVEPFIHEGTTYLPVRAVGEALGKTVGWDDVNKSVYLTTTREPTPPTTPTDPYVPSEPLGSLNVSMQSLGTPTALLQDIEPISYGPDRLSTRLVKPCLGLYDILGFKMRDGIAFYNSTATTSYEVTYNLDGQYRLFAGKISLTSDADDYTHKIGTFVYTLTIIADGEVVFVSKKYDDMVNPFEAVVDIKNAQEVTFRINSVTNQIEGTVSNILIPITAIGTAGLYK